MYVTAVVDDWVHVVDLEKNAVTDNIVVGTGPRGFLLMPDGKELWVLNELSGQVSIIDRGINRVTESLEFRPPGARGCDTHGPDRNQGCQDCFRYAQPSGRRCFC